VLLRLKKIAAYCRVSTDKADQANSFGSQQKYFKEYIGRMPEYELVEIFADEGTSGTSTKKRAAFNRMIEDAFQGKFGLIITKEISRFARNTLDSIYYTRELKKRGVGVFFLNDNINTLDPDAELRLTIMSSIAQEESRKTSERVKWGQKRRMEQGVVFGRSMLGYDVRDGKMYINPDGARVVRLIFGKFVNEQKGTHVIARELREAGIKPMRVKEWQNTVILRIIRNEKYCGDLVQKKTITPDYLSHDKKYNRGEEAFVFIKDHHEPIISREMFEAANKILDERALSQAGKAKHSNRYPFSGKIKCGDCGKSFVARSKKRKNGTKYKTWCCYEYVKNGKRQAGASVGCAYRSISDSDAMYIMSLVTQSLIQVNQKATKSLVRVIKDVLSQDCPVQADSLIEQAREKKSRLIELYMSKDITRGEFTAAREKCEQELAELSKITGTKEPNQPLTDISGMVERAAATEEFYRNLLNRMVVNDDRSIDVYLNHSEHKWSFL